MTKKDIKFVPPVVEPEKKEEPLFESEAYGSPQPDAGMDTTVTKPIGIGGPVPIVAPKHNTIQLQPIIVPLAVVPYMTQDSDVLRTDAPAAPYGYSSSTMGETEFQRAETEKIKKEKGITKKKSSSRARFAAFLSALLSGILVAGYLLAKFLPDLGGINLGSLNVIDQITSWIGGTAPANLITTILYTVSAALAAISFIISLISLFVGKMPRALMSVISLFYLAPFLVDVGIKLAKGGFVAANEKGMLIMLGVAGLAFIVCLISAIIGDKKESGKDDRKVNFDSGSEI